MNIATQRHQLNMSVPQFAERLGVNERTVRRWEDGTRQPSTLTLRFIASILAQSDKGTQP